MATAAPENHYDPAKRHWELGFDAHAPYLTSTYRDDMVEKKGKQAAMSAAAKADLRSVHFDYGTASAVETVGGQTSMQAHFKGLAGGPQGLPVETMADLRASHFQTGYSADKSKMYSTTSGELNGARGPPATLSKAVKADLRKSHFDVGMRDYEKKSLAKTDFESRAGVTSKIRPGSMDMPAETMADLRRVHFQYGFEGVGQYSTESTAVHPQCPPLPCCVLRAACGVLNVCGVVVARQMVDALKAAGGVPPVRANPYAPR
jgi:hypothetical protein